MRPKTIWFVAIVAAVVLGISCSDSPTGPRTPPGALAPGGCAVEVNTLRAMPGTVFGAGTPAAIAVRARIDTIYSALNAGDIVRAQAKAHETVAYIHDNAAAAQGTASQLDTLVNTILCWVGLPETSFIVPPSSQPQVLRTIDGTAGIQIPANGVSEPTIITITVVDDHLLTTDDTKLDRYPRSVSITSSVPVANSTVGVCLTDIPATVFPRLRMGHRTKDGFKIEPPAPVDFLNCDSSTGSASRGVFRRALSSVARFILPKPLFAKQEAFLSGGVGGTAGEYSPFEPVDTELSFSGGVGGTAGEYLRLQGANVVSGGVCTAVDAVVGGSVETECRPRIEVKTANGTVLANVPVTWAIGGGGGTTASENTITRACGTFGATATATTNASGKAGACWTLGANVGANTLVATVTAGGDAPPGVTFSPSSQTFTATGLAFTPTATAMGESAAFDGQPHPGSGACSHGLTPALSYSGNGSVPVSVGNYTLTVTCGAGNPNSNTVTATAEIVIGAAAANIAINCPASVAYTGEPRTPCSATVTAPGLNTTVPITYTANLNAGMARASATVASTASYNGSTATRDFQIEQAPTTTTVTCPTSVGYAGVALTPCTVVTIGPLLDEVGVPVYAANINAGTATATFTFPESGNYLGSTGTKTFSIARAPATATAGSGSMPFGGAVPSLPCVVTVLPMDAGVVSCTTTVPSPLVAGANVTTPNFTGSPNYDIAPINGTLTVGFIQSDCFNWPLSQTLPPKSSGYASGSLVAAICVLRNADGSVYTGASGHLEVFDVGPNGTSTPQRIVNRPDAFGFFLGAYWAWISTDDFAGGRYYLVTATWNDGSTSGGYFYLRN